MVKRLKEITVTRTDIGIGLIFDFNLDAQNGPDKTAAIGQMFSPNSKMLEVADVLENMARNVRLLEKRLK